MFRHKLSLINMIGNKGGGGHSQVEIVIYTMQIMFQKKGGLLCSQLFRMKKMADENKKYTCIHVLVLLICCLLRFLIEKLSRCFFQCLHFNNLTKCLMEMYNPCSVILFFMCNSQIVSMDVAKLCTVLTLFLNLGAAYGTINALKKSTFFM